MMLVKKTILLLVFLILFNIINAADLAETKTEEIGATCLPMPDCPRPVYNCRDINPLLCCPTCDCSGIRCAAVNQTECEINGGTFKRRNPILGICCDQCMSICDRVLCPLIEKCNGRIIKADRINGRCCDKCDNMCDFVKCQDANETDCKAVGGTYVPRDPSNCQCCSYCRTNQATTISGATTTASTTGSTSICVLRPVPCPYIDMARCRLSGGFYIPPDYNKNVCCARCEPRITIEPQTLGTTSDRCAAVFCLAVNPDECKKAGNTFIPANPPTRCCDQCIPPITVEPITTTTGSPCDTVRCIAVDADACKKSGMQFIPASPPSQCCDQCKPLITVGPISTLGTIKPINPCLWVKCANVSPKACILAGLQFQPANPAQGICCDRCIEKPIEVNPCFGIKCLYVDPIACIKAGHTFQPANPAQGQCCDQCIKDDTVHNPCELVKCLNANEKECVISGGIFQPANPPDQCCDMCVREPIFTIEPQPTISASIGTVGPISPCALVRCLYVDPWKCYLSGGVYQPAAPPFRCCASCRRRVFPTLPPFNPCSLVKCLNIQKEDCLRLGLTFSPANPPTKCCNSCVNRLD